MNPYLKQFQRMVLRSNSKRMRYNRKQRCSPTYSIKDKLHTATMKNKLIIESRREISVMMTCDVLVVGGGPAGISAAIAAARTGSDTVIIDRFGAFGGVITQVGMETLAWYRYEGCIEINGIGKEMERQAVRMGGASKWFANDSQCLDSEHFKLVADDLITKNGITPIFYCLAVEAIIDENTIKGVIVESKSGRQAILAKCVIDCTGDADIAYYSGCSFFQSKKEERLGVSMVFSAANVNKQRFLTYVEDNPRTYKDWGDEWQVSSIGKELELATPYLGKEFHRHDWKIALPSHIQVGGTWSSINDEGEAKNLNLVYIKNIDGTDVHDLTRATIEGRVHCMNALDALKKNIPGFEKAILRSFSNSLGVRDTRKINGQYNLSAHDVLSQGRFKDSIGLFPEFLDGYNILTLPTTGRYFEIPFRCLMPIEIDNLLVAGRAVAGDYVSHAAMRNMMACTVTGQAAGVAAGVSVNKKVSIHRLTYEWVQKELLRQGVRIH